MCDTNIIFILYIIHDYYINVYSIMLCIIILTCIPNCLQLLTLNRQNYVFNKKNAINMTATVVMNTLIEGK